MEHSQKFQPDLRHLAEVRRFVSDVADVDVGHPAVLVVSELATNVLVHARTPFKVKVRTEPEIRIEVTDESPEVPVVTRAGASGFGLRLVDALGSKWGFDPAAKGKTVWVEVPKEKPPGWSTP